MSEEPNKRGDAGRGESAKKDGASADASKLGRAHTGAVGPAPSSRGDSTSGAAASGDDDITELMRQQAPDLDAEALVAAESAIADGERALAEARSAAESLGRLTKQRRRPAAPALRQSWLRVLLLVNLALMGLVLVWPFEPAPPPTPADGAGAAPPDAAVDRTHPVEQPTPPAAAPVADPWERPARQAVPLTRVLMYQQALELAGRQQYDAALDLLDRYLRANPTLPSHERLIVLNAMSIYAVQANRVADAQEYERQITKLKARGYLPDDLIASARRAEAEGNGGDMRRLWARFLLQQRQLSPAQRKFVAEAYLRLGDGYRIDAERGEQQERQANAAAAAAAAAASSGTGAAGAAQGADRRATRQAPDARRASAAPTADPDALPEPKREPSRDAPREHDAVPDSGTTLPPVGR